MKDTGDDAILKREILYLLNIRKIGGKHERQDDSGGNGITSVIKNLCSSNSKEYIYNERIMMTLIESGFIHNEFSYLNPGEYPNFLKHILLNSERIKLKEAACR